MGLLFLNRALIAKNKKSFRLYENINMPHPHKIKLKAAVRNWQEEGHMIRTTKAGMMGESSEASSEVARSCAGMSLRRRQLFFLNETGETFSVAATSFLFSYYL
jgi:hypothetical protein